MFLNRRFFVSFTWNKGHMSGNGNQFVMYSGPIRDSDDLRDIEAFILGEHGFDKCVALNYRRTGMELMVTRRTFWFLAAAVVICLLTGGIFAFPLAYEAYSYAGALAVVATFAAIMFLFMRLIPRAKSKE